MHFPPEGARPSSLDAAWIAADKRAVMNWIHWSLLSALFAGATAILAKVGVAGVNSHLATAVRTSVVLVLAWLIVAATGAGAGLAGVSRRSWVFLVLSGIATGLSWLCYFRALQLGDAARVASLDKLSVVFVIGFAALFLHEVVTWKTAAGGILIIAGAVLLTLK